ncbi:hypothetical protein FRB91_003123 [Serendipita sp. 411]|nr:hypothetical protein FRB91_003123 [Serendipita sp. 411]
MHPSHHHHHHFHFSLFLFPLFVFFSLSFSFFHATVSCTHTLVHPSPTPLPFSAMRKFAQHNFSLPPHQKASIRIPTRTLRTNSQFRDVRLTDGILPAATAQYRPALYNAAVTVLPPNISPPPPPLLPLTKFRLDSVDAK